MDRQFGNPLMEIQPFSKQGDRVMHKPLCPQTNVETFTSNMRVTVPGGPVTEHLN